MKTKTITILTPLLFTIAIACTNRQNKLSNTKISSDTIITDRPNLIMDNDSLIKTKRTIYDYEEYNDVKEIVEALKSGDLKTIRGMSTDKGYKDLLKVIPTHQDKGNICKQIGNDLSTAIFYAGVSEEMIDYYDFEIKDKRITMGILPLKDEHKMIVFKMGKIK